MSSSQTLMQIQALDTVLPKTRLGPNGPGQWSAPCGMCRPSRSHSLFICIYRDVHCLQVRCIPSVCFSVSLSVCLSVSLQRASKRFNIPNFFYCV